MFYSLFMTVTSNSLRLLYKLKLQICRNLCFMWKYFVIQWSRESKKTWNCIANKLWLNITFGHIKLLRIIIELNMYNKMFSLNNKCHLQINSNVIDVNVVQQITFLQTIIHCNFYTIICTWFYMNNSCNPRHMCWTWQLITLMYIIFAVSCKSESSSFYITNGALYRRSLVFKSCGWRRLLLISTFNG